MANSGLLKQVSFNEYRDYRETVFKVNPVLNVLSILHRTVLCKRKISKTWPWEDVNKEKEKPEGSTPGLG